MRGRRRAAILVLTLWMVVVLGLISASMLEEIHLELKIARLQRNDLEAMALARAGLARGIVDLRNDYWMDRLRQGQPFDSLGEVWARSGRDRRDDDRIEVPMGRGTFSVWVDDESAKLPLNVVAPSPHPNLMTSVLIELGMEKKDAGIVASAIRDYVDPDDVAQPPGTGKEDEYYSAQIAEATKVRWNAERDAPLYRCKNAPFSSVDELLQVPGVTPELFYGVDPEQELPLNPIAQLKAREEDDRRARRRNERKLGLRDVFSVHSPGAVNLNTADEFTLRIAIQALVNTPELAASYTEKIMNARKVEAGSIFTNDNVFRSVQDLSRVSGLPPQLFSGLTRVIPLGVRSDVYRIHALGEVGASQHLICAVVRRSYEKMQPDRLTALFEHGVIHDRLIERFQRRHGDRRDPIEDITVRVIQWYDL